MAAPSTTPTWAPLLLKILPLMTDLPEAPALPPKVSLEEARGFTLWATRSILSGDGSAELEGARTNLRRLAVE